MSQSTASKRAVLLAIAMAITTVPGTVVAGEMEFDRSRVPAALVGTWRVTMTPYICATGVALPQFARPQLITFGDGGTVVEGSGSPDFQPGQRSPGHGYWERTGPQSFRTVIEAFILFTSVATPPTPPRYVQGSQRFDHGIEMENADRWSSYASVTFFNSSGTPVPPSGCARATAERMR
jgi:hypothetical protein